MNKTFKNESCALCKAASQTERVGTYLSEVGSLYFDYSKRNLSVFYAKRCRGCWEVSKILSIWCLVDMLEQLRAIRADYKLFHHLQQEEARKQGKIL